MSSTRKQRVSIEMTATTPSQADHPRWLHDPSAETPASINNNNNDKDPIQRGLSLNSQRLIKYNVIKVKNLNSSEMQIVELN